VSSCNDSQPLARRLKVIRIQLFGEHGLPELAKQLGVPPETWANYEQGVTMPAEVLLAFIELTSVDSHWLLTGEGSPRRSRSSDTLRRAVAFSVN
jgi:hypothetical protein